MDLDNDFGEELRFARERGDLTREDLHRMTNFSVSLIAQVERGEKSPSLDFAQRMDAALDTSGLLERIRARNLRHRVVPDWFRAYRENEQQATKIVSFEDSLVPGLFQTPEYAKVLLGDDDRVAGRMQRQGIVDRAEVVAIIAERVLHTRIGDATVMVGQLERLLASPATVQVLPSDTDAYVWLNGPFYIVTVDGGEVVYTPTQLRGYLLDFPPDLDEARRRLEAIRAEALPRNLSRERMQGVAEKWRSET